MDNDIIWVRRKSFSLFNDSDSGKDNLKSNINQIKRQSKSLAQVTTN